MTLLLKLEFHTVRQKPAIFIELQTIEGAKLEIYHVYRDSYSEILDIRISLAHMVTWAEKGLNVKLYGTNRDQILIIPKAYFQGVLDALEK